MPQFLVLRVFLPFAFGYFASSAFRSINAVIAPQLVRDIGLDATDLGFIGSMYFVGAMLFQLPLGVLVDRYGPRVIYTLCLCCGALGAALYGLADSVGALAIGRMLTAIATTSSAVCSLKMYATWYPRERLPFINGLGFSAGGLGVMMGTRPVEMALPYIDWRSIHFIIAALILLAAIYVFTAAPLVKKSGPAATLLEEIMGLKRVLSDINFLRVAPLLVITVGALGAMQSLWAGNWLRDVARLNSADAANILLAIAAAMTLSFFSSGFIAKVLKRYGLTPIHGAMMASFMFCFVLAMLAFQSGGSVWFLGSLWFVFAFLATLVMLTYAGLGQIFPIDLVGRVNACLHLCWMLGVFFLQNVIGFVLNQFPTAIEGAYAAAGHRLAMAIILALNILALLWYMA
ncbi:MAG: MFS transporter, partial [Rhodospirillales bacterium]|nr:MFS transporter [Rhodospirillales bacterium]